MEIVYTSSYLIVKRYNQTIKTIRIASSQLWANSIGLALLSFTHSQVSGLLVCLYSPSPQFYPWQHSLQSPFPCSWWQPSHVAFLNTLSSNCFPFNLVCFLTAATVECENQGGVWNNLCLFFDFSHNSNTFTYLFYDQRSNYLASPVQAFLQHCGCDVDPASYIPTDYVGKLTMWLHRTLVLTLPQQKDHLITFACITL